MIKEELVVAHWIEPEDLHKLRAIAARLLGGHDKERNEGNKLLLIVTTLERNPIKEGELT